MSAELIIRPEAEADVREAYGWYDEQVPGLGRELLAELDRELAVLLANPEVHAKVHRNMRRALLRKFTFGVFYVVESDRIVVLAILHTARSPEIWSRREQIKRRSDT